MLDDSYLSAEKVSINRYMDDTVAPSEATQGYAYTIYDQNYIYSYIEVFDATPVSYTHLDVYKRQICVLFAGSQPD